MMDTITVRKMPFVFPDEIDPVFIEGDPEASFNMIAASLLLPHLEPYLIRSMRAAMDHVTDPQVLDDLKRFSAQEGQHYRAHAKFNAAVQKAGFPKLAELEQELADDYKRFSETKSLQFNLAYAEGFEALTMNMIKFIMEPNGFENPDSPIFQMFEWHFVEELEHRTVTFDVYDHVCGGYLYRLFVGIYAQWHFMSWIRKVSAYMLEVMPPPKRSEEELKARKRKEREDRRDAFRRLLPAVIRIYLPNYSPHKVEISPAMEILADKYTAMANSTS
jgi:predicted metal-dependent hydrolase